MSLMKVLNDDAILDRVGFEIKNTSLVNVSKLTSISPGHLWSLVNKREVYKLSDKMKERIEKSGMLV